MYERGYPAALRLLNADLTVTGVEASSMDPSCVLLRRQSFLQARLAMSK